MTTAQTTNSAHAGNRGPDVRSDCCVKVTRTDSGGVTVTFKSKVESMYGDSTRTLVAEAAGKMGVAHAHIEIEDAGALPFVILARLETALRRLGQDVGDGHWPDASPASQYETTRERFRRSRLYLPGNAPKFMPSAGLHGPDAVILDLEDSVAPTEKDAARILVRNALRVLDFQGAERMVRINQGEMGLTDLDFVAAHNVHVILIPKVESPEQVREVDERIRKIQSRAAGFSPRDSSGTDKLTDSGTIAQAKACGSGARTIFLMPIIESALGAIRAYEIATASERIVALTIGLEDYTADIGTARTAEGRESFWARSQVVNAARAAGVTPIDTVFSDVADTQGLRASVIEAKSLGFEGKGCIHPRQIQTIHEAFAPSAEELEKAKQIVEAFEQAQAKGLGVVSLGTKMIDAPVVKRAQRIVNQAEAMGE